MLKRIKEKIANFIVINICQSLKNEITKIAADEIYDAIYHNLDEHNLLDYIQNVKGFQNEIKLIKDLTYKECKLIDLQTRTLRDELRDSIFEMDNNLKESNQEIMSKFNEFSDEFKKLSQEIDNLKKFLVID